MTKNALTITEGQTVLLINANLNVFGLIPFDLLPFVVTGVLGGRFTFVNDSTTAIFNFTQAQVNNNQVQFISDRTNVVAYQVGMANITSGQIVLAPTPANVTFINNAPVVLNAPTVQIIDVNQPFNFTLLANQIFNDTDGDPLTYSAQLSDGSPLPNWLQFDATQPNELVFRGTALIQERIQISLIAKDPINATASTKFEILTFGTNVNNEASTAQIVAGGVVGGAIVLATLIGSGFGFWRYATNKNTRKGEPFADAIHAGLNLKDVDDFDSDAGQQFVAFVHSLQMALKQAGLDTHTMRPLELRQLADDVADAARNKISPAADCLGRSVITVTDLSDNLQNLVNEVQVLRAGGQKYR